MCSLANKRVIVMLILALKLARFAPLTGNASSFTPKVCYPVSKVDSVDDSLK
jgi:hypothetical protein